MDPAELRHLLRVDALSLALGALLAFAGLVSTALWAGRRPREAALLWLGLFAWLYGARLLARTTTFRLCFDLAAPSWDRVAAALTYLVPVPLLLFARATMPQHRRRLGWFALGAGAFALAAILSDALAQRADTARVPNNALAVAFIVLLLGALFRPGLPPSRELRTLRVGVLTASATALADNLRGMGFVAFPGPDLEPLGFTVLVFCLGTLATWRVLAEARRLVAIDRELGIARQIQTSILPREMPQVVGLRVAARYQPMTAVAGDFYDFLEPGGRRLGVLVADVSGHGVPAALIASMVKVALAAQAARAEDPALVLAGMNDTLYGRLGGQYVTAAYLFLDPEAGRIRYAAAGHPPMLRVRRGQPELGDTEQNGFPLGLMEGVRYERQEQPLEEGDRFLLYTDGLIEAVNAAEDSFGVERLNAAVVAAAPLPPDEAAQAVLNAMNAFSGRSASDDLTLILIERTSVPSAPL
jgi:sigma-B regulation protein RsbU (phosphoserine phosphatase)